MLILLLGKSSISCRFLHGVVAAFTSRFRTFWCHIFPSRNRLKIVPFALT
jgi:hypothetical protein